MKNILSLEGKHIFDSFYETHLFLHFNRKWESKFKSDILDKRINCIHLTIISYQHCVLVILMQEERLLNLLPIILNMILII